MRTDRPYPPPEGHVDTIEISSFFSVLYIFDFLSLNIQSFRDPSKLLSEAGYVLTQVVSAVCFLEEVDASVLSIAHGEFERGLKGFQETAREGLQAHQLKVSYCQNSEEVALFARHAEVNFP